MDMYNWENGQDTTEIRWINDILQKNETWIDCDFKVFVGFISFARQDPRTLVKVTVRQ